MGAKPPRNLISSALQQAVVAVALRRVAVALLQAVVAVALQRVAVVQRVVLAERVVQVVPERVVQVVLRVFAGRMLPGVQGLQLQVL